MQMGGDWPPTAEELEWADMLESQRRVIEEESAVLVELGFNLEDFALAAEPATEERPKDWRREVYKRFSIAGTGYLALNAVSTKVPGPMWALRLAPHIRLLSHIAALAHTAPH